MLRRVFAAAIAAAACAAPIAPNGVLRAQSGPAGGSPIVINPPITVFVVRHAEKGPGTPDPDLTDAGRARADELARVLRGNKFAAVYATEFKRTQETAAPLAKAAGIAPRQILARDVDGLVADLRALPPGSHALVVSHSNLVHLIVERLSGVKVPELTDADYDRLVVVTVTGPARGDAVVLRFGAP